MTADTARPSVLLTVSGSIPVDLATQIDAGRRPRPDYVALAERLGADLVDVDVALRAHRRIGPLLRRLGVGVLLAWYCFRRRRHYDVVLTDGEQVGLPYAAMTRVGGRGRARHVMIVHVLSVGKKAWPLRIGRLSQLIDHFLVYASSQRDFVVDALGVDPNRVTLTPFTVDTHFFDPDAVDVERRRTICSAGLERRDYPTLMEAVSGLDVDVVIAAASPWSKQPDSSAGRSVPTNVRIERLDLHQLRDLYASARFVVMPLVDVDFQAGITTILEAMSMGRAVICTRTIGQTDTIVEGETGRYVPPADAAALRRAIELLLDRPEEADEIGRRARRWTLEHAALERYADAVAAAVDAAWVRTV